MRIASCCGVAANRREPRLPPRTVSLAWHRDLLGTCTAGLFVDLAVEVAAGLGPAGPR